MTRYTLPYQSGFGNEFATEALAGALLSGAIRRSAAPTAYMPSSSAAPRSPPRARQSTQLAHRIRPSACTRRSSASTPAASSAFRRRRDPAEPAALEPAAAALEADRLRRGIATMAGNGDPHQQVGAAVHLNVANRSMTRKVFYSADGELLIVPQHGRHRFVTELGAIDAEPQEIVVIPRGMRFRVELPDGAARGYVCENHGANFKLPDLGPIGSNGLANPRDFLTPVAAYEDIDEPHQLVAKFMGHLWSAQVNHSPLDVVAWHGNYAPYKYDLRRFNAIGSISHDHPDPSIFLVLHSASDTSGVSSIDFVIFPPRILVMQDTFRPPWFHRNIASEFMGLIHGAYDAKAEGFSPGGASLHNSMTGHGPDADTFEKASSADLSKPHVITDTMAFMFETRFVLRPTRHALESAQLQDDYYRCWQGLKKHFDPRKP
jgi:homogentisate 1,2-dioxygenase